MKFPGPHSSQPVAPSNAENVVGGQVRHAARMLAPRVVPYKPGVQLVQMRRTLFGSNVEYLPGSHAAHDVAPLDEEVPLGQIAQGVEKLKSWSWVPALHREHVHDADRFPSRPMFAFELFSPNTRESMSASPGLRFEKQFTNTRHRRLLRMCSDSANTSQIVLTQAPILQNRTAGRGRVHADGMQINNFKSQ